MMTRGGEGEVMIERKEALNGRGRAGFMRDPTELFRPGRPFRWP